MKHNIFQLIVVKGKITKFWKTFIFPRTSNFPNLRQERILFLKVQSEIRPFKSSTRIKILSPGLENVHTLKCFPVIFQHNHRYISGLLQKCRTKISVYLFTLIQGTRSYKDEKLRVKSVPYFNKNQDLGPLIGE